ncbi:unnamed protein product [Cuscuta campestris]|uniref:TF-B3 domain-containing protein n=1 Tax=Cuscuta campestris TaxID=132261 RepID=A0A484N055_9ASTE|nr:unnamed protein product [Cuscuta campestris]
MASSSRRVRNSPQEWSCCMPRESTDCIETLVIPSDVLSPSEKIVLLLTRIGYFPVEHYIGDDGKHRFKSGWKDFAVAHQLQPKFVLHFKKNGEFCLLVTVFGKYNWVTYPIMFPDYDSGEDDVDIEISFVHKLEAHNVIPKESYLELPRSFCADNGISDGTIKIKIYGPTMYPNEVTLSVKESGCRLSKGWHNFVEDNGLRLGDKVVLTFIAENTIIVYAYRHRMLPRLTNY